MKLLRALVRAGVHQVRNMGKILRKERLLRPSLGSMTLDKDDVEIAKKWLRHQDLWESSEITVQYENEFKKWNGSKHAFAFMSGREALSACIFALNLQPGDEVILPGYTCVVVPNAFQFADLKIVYCDIELETFGMDVGCLKQKLTDQTRAILLHHLYGLVCRDYEAIIELAKKRGLKIIEDCAHAVGAEYKNKKVGNYGDVAFYSSEQSKVFNTIQGGIAVTNDKIFADRLLAYQQQAPYPDKLWINKQLYNVILCYYQSKHTWRWWLGDIVEILYGNKRLIATSIDESEGVRPEYYGRRMPAPIADLGRNQLRKIDHYNYLRRLKAKYWDSWCDSKGYKKPFVISESRPVYLRYPVLVEPEKKEDTSWSIRELNVDVGVWFLTNTHPVKRLVEGCPKADEAVKGCINLPCLE